MQLQGSFYDRVINMRLLESLLFDLRGAYRFLRRSPGWSAVVLISLAIGIGANVTVFSIVNGLFLRTIAVNEPETLVRLTWTGQNNLLTGQNEFGYTASNAAGETLHSTFSYATFLALRDRNRTLDGLLAAAPLGTLNVVADGRAELATVLVVSGNFFDLLGVPAQLGRTLNDADDRANSIPVAMISHSYWRQRFGEDPGVLGSVVSIYGRPVTIAGVIPREFNGIVSPDAAISDVVIPHSLFISEYPGFDNPRFWTFVVMGRLRSGVDIGLARDDLAVVFRQTLQEQFGAELTPSSPSQLAQSLASVPQIYVDSGSRGIYDPNPDTVVFVRILGVVVGLVLLIVCLNLTTLLSARAVSRRKDLAIRSCLGATRLELLRGLVIEGLLLGCSGGVLGAMVAYWGRDLLPFGHNSPLDYGVFGSVFVLSVLAGGSSGFVSAWSGTQLHFATAMQGGVGSSARSTNRSWRALVGLQVAVSVVLLVGAGLLIRTLSNLRDVELGFNPRNVLIFSVDPSLNSYGPERSALLYDELHSALEAVPGIRSVARTNTVLLSGVTSGTILNFRSRVASGDEVGSVVNSMVVSPEFFGTMEIPVIRGRSFTDQDDQASPRVAIINETAAREYFPNSNPVGEFFGRSAARSGEIQIVGVARDTKLAQVREVVVPTIYEPQLQSRVGLVTFLIRTTDNPLSLSPILAETVRTIDPELPTDFTTQSGHLEERLERERFLARSFSLFGGLTVFLACLGIYGVVSYSVAQRRREIGIRLAIGAVPSGIRRMFLKESLGLVTVGIAVGLVVVQFTGRFLETYVFGLAPTDPTSVFSAVLLMLCVSMLASYLPARRASRVDPQSVIK